MKSPTPEQITKLFYFALPCYWPLVLMFIVVVIWKTGLNEPDLIPLAGVSIAIIAAAVLLVKKYYWISLPMILLGAYIFIALRNEEGFGQMFQLYGAYLILHYLACGIYVFKNRKKE